ATDRLTHIIHDLLNARNIELEGFDLKSSNVKSPKKKSSNLSGYVKLEDMASDGTPRDKNPFLKCLPEDAGIRHKPNITFASSTTKSPATQYEQSASPESTTSSSSGLMQFTEYLTADGGLFPPNADAFNPDSSLLFDIDDPMGNANPFLSLPSVDWNDWTDWT